MSARIALAAATALWLAGCGSGDADPAEAGKGGWSIPAGTYGNLAQSAGHGDMAGVELRLDKGSESDAVEIVLCEGGCGRVETRPLRRGLNGISFTLPAGGRTLDVMVQPAGKDAVTFNIDRDDGLRSETLPRIEREVGLAAARGGTEDH
ncbi:MAG TPA: hypothetical protein PKC77_08620 [Sphingopyxis sp.]|nr:hypothetical protein [Sphingopyxis sp.]